MMIIKAMKSKRKVLVVRQTAVSLKDSVWQMTLDTLEFFKLYQYCEVNISDKKIKLPNGSIFLFKGCENVERLKSITNLTDIIIEEATELNYESFLQLDIRLRHPTAKNQQIVLMFNPVSKANWCYKHWFDTKDTKNTDDVRVIHTTYKNNRFLPQKQIEVLENLKKVDEAYYRIYALGEFGSLNKLVFKNWEVRDVTEEELIGAKINIGMDFGFTNDPTTAVKVAYKKETETVYVLDEFYKKGMLTQEIYDEVIRKNMARYSIEADIAEQRLIKELRNKGLIIKGAKKGPDSILFGIDWLKAKRIVVVKSCSHIIEELENYTWMKNKDGEYINTPIDSYNHCLDALRYATVPYHKKGFKTKQKSALGLR